jgi:hypothetical protein
MQEELDLDEPYFTSGEAARVAGIDEKLFGVWLYREILRPAREEKKTGKGRRRGGRLFSVITIFEARIVIRLVNHLAMTPSEASKASKRAAAGKWKLAVLRGLETSKPVHVYSLLWRMDDCWNTEIAIANETGTLVTEPKMGPFAVVPVGSDLSSVYEECWKIRYETSETTNSRGQ